MVSDLLQVKDQSSLGQPSANGQPEKIFDMEKKILFEIIELLKVRLTKAQKEKLKRPLTTSYRALIYLSLGLDASDRGNYGSADFYYRKALEQDPQLTPATNAIKELHGPEARDYQSQEQRCPGHTGRAEFIDAQYQKEYLDLQRIPTGSQR